MQLPESTVSGYLTGIRCRFLTIQIANSYYSPAPLITSLTYCNIFFPTLSPFCPSSLCIYVYIHVHSKPPSLGNFVYRNNVILLKNDLRWRLRLLSLLSSKFMSNYRVISCEKGQIYLNASRRDNKSTNINFTVWIFAAFYKTSSTTNNYFSGQAVDYWLHNKVRLWNQKISFNLV